MERNLAETEEKLTEIAHHVAAVDREEDKGVSTDSGAEAWFMTYLDTITLVLTLFVFVLSTSTMSQGEGERDREGEGTQILEAMVSAVRSVEEIVVMRNNIPNLDAIESKIADREAMSAEVARLHETIFENRLENDVELVVAGRSVKLQIKDSLLFSSGSASLSPGGLDAILILEPALSAIPGIINVEGHTDNIPIQSMAFPSNWELSSARASAVIRVLEDSGVARTRLRAIGYADTAPIADNESPEGRQQNRRVTIDMNLG